MSDRWFGPPSPASCCSNLQFRRDCCTFNRDSSIPVGSFDGVKASNNERLTFGFPFFLSVALDGTAVGRRRRSISSGNEGHSSFDVLLHLFRQCCSQIVVWESSDWTRFRNFQFRLMIVLRVVKSQNAKMSRWTSETRDSNVIGLDGRDEYTSICCESSHEKPGMSVGTAVVNDDKLVVDADLPMAEFLDESHFLTGRMTNGGSFRLFA